MTAWLSNQLFHAEFARFVRAAVTTFALTYSAAPLLLATATSVSFTRTLQTSASSEHCIDLSMTKYGTFDCAGEQHNLSSIFQMPINRRIYSFWIIRLTLFWLGSDAKLNTIIIIKYASMAMYGFICCNITQRWITELSSLGNLGEGGLFFIFRLFQSILFFVNWISLYFFYLL